MFNRGGYSEIVVLLIGITTISLILGLTLFAGFQASEERVSGVVYNTTNDSWISGNTRFSIRASEDTYVSEENKSSYCLPPESPYIELVNRAAEDKTIKVVVTAGKYFAIKSPWTCIDNVTVTEQPVVKENN